MTSQTKVNLEKAPPPSAPQELKLPHERDQSTQEGGVKIDEHAKKAAKDAIKGVPDTSRGAEADAAYQRQKQP